MLNSISHLIGYSYTTSLLFIEILELFYELAILATIEYYPSHMQQLAIVYYVSVPKQVVILSIMADSNPPPLLLISTKALSCTVRYNTINFFY